MTSALLLAGCLLASDPAGKPVDLTLEDQFARPQSLAAVRGDVVILVYGDRKATDACRGLGERLHVAFHPTAAGQPGAKARAAPVVPLDGVPSGKRSPDVVVLPVACVGKVPGAVRELLRGQMRSAMPDVPVWLDFTGVMEKDFTLRPGEPNVLLFDAVGRLRLKVNGTPDKPSLDKLLQSAQNLRAEAAGLK